MERANKPLQRHVDLIDLELRRMELASRPARRELERLQKIPGLSGDVIRAQEAIVQKYDDQIASLQDQQDALQIEIDTRRMEIDLIRDGTDSLQDQANQIEDNIDSTEGLIKAKQDYIKTLVPPQLLQEIEQLRHQRDLLDIQRQKLELLIPAKHAVRNTPAFDSMINEAQAAAERAQAVLDRLHAIRQIGVITAKLNIDAPSLRQILILISALAKGLTDITAFQRLIRLSAMPGLHGWLEAIIAHYSRGELAAAIQVTAMPFGFQKGGIVKEPTFAALAERRIPEAVIPLERTARSRGLLSHAMESILPGGSSGEARAMVVAQDRSANYMKKLITSVGKGLDASSLHAHFERSTEFLGNIDRHQEDQHNAIVEGLRVRTGDPSRLDTTALSSLRANFERSVEFLGNIDRHQEEQHNAIVEGLRVRTSDPSRLDTTTLSSLRTNFERSVDFLGNIDRHQEDQHNAIVESLRVRTSEPSGLDTTALSSLRASFERSTELLGNIDRHQEDQHNTIVESLRVRTGNLSGLDTATLSSLRANFERSTEFLGNIDRHQ